jgi:hypothetical protein
MLTGGGKVSSRGVDSQTGAPWPGAKSCDGACGLRVRGYIGLVGLSLLLAVGVGAATAEDRAASRAVGAMQHLVAPAALERSTVEVRAVVDGWLVVFHDVNVSCGGREGPFAIGACRVNSSATYRDGYVCVDRWAFMPGRWGFSPETLGLEDSPCAMGRPAAPPGPA